MTGAPSFAPLAYLSLCRTAPLHIGDGRIFHLCAKPVFGSVWKPASDAGSPRSVQNPGGAVHPSEENTDMARAVKFRPSKKPKVTAAKKAPRKGSGRKSGGGGGGSGGGKGSYKPSNDPIPW